MFKATIKSVLSHKVRLALTALSIVLGVAFVAGTFVLTDTIQGNFDNLVKQATSKSDVSVRSKMAFQSRRSMSNERDPMPASVLDTVKNVKGVSFAVGYVQGYAQLVDKHGKQVSTGHAPAFGGSASGLGNLSPFRLKKGRVPRNGSELVVDAGTAAGHHIAIGDRVHVLFSGPPGTFKVVGTVGFGSADNLMGASFVLFDMGTAQQRFGKVGKLDEVAVRADKGTTPEDLAGAISKVLPRKLEAITSAAAADETSKTVQNALSGLNVALLVFAGIALFVGSFIIYNTFSIIVSQRTKELALLRALGASRGQVTRSMLGEAVLTGLVASAVGIGAGVLLAIGLRGLMSAVGMKLPGTGMTIKSRAVWWPLTVGLVITVVASYLPARKAAKVPPVAAMRDLTITERSLHRRVVGGSVVTLLGGVLLLVGLFSKGGIGLVGFGAFLTFLGVAVLSPGLARPLARLIGAPMAAALAGRLGRENAMRNPRRTSATAAALMIGLALATLVTIMASSLSASSSAVLDRLVTADYLINPKQAMGDGNTISADLAVQLRKRKELATVASARGGEWRLQGVRKIVTAVDPATIGAVTKLGVTEGSLARLGTDGVLVYEKTAKTQHLSLGSRLPMEFARTGVQRFVVRGIYSNNQVVGNWVISIPAYDRNFTDRLDALVGVKLAKGVSRSRGRAVIERVAKGFPNTAVRDQAQFKKQQQGQVNTLLTMVYVLLALAIVIALLGIVNTLALSVFERTRELGLLRAVGMSRRQVKRMIRTESVIIAVLGALLGLVIGLFFGWAIVRALHDQGVTEFAVPYGRLVVLVLFAALSGVAAAAFPARRAARLDVLAAIATE